MLKKDIKKEVEVVEVPVELKPQEEIVLPEEVVEDTKDINIDGIEISIPKSTKIQEFPLVVKLPATASLAQIQYAKVINAYAYQNPKKFTGKKDSMIKHLIELKNAPDPIESNLKVNNSGI